jgi:hypothetical protein
MYLAAGLRPPFTPLTGNPAAYLSENHAVDGPRHKNHEEITSSSSGILMAHVQLNLRRLSTDIDNSLQRRESHFNRLAVNQKVSS